MTCKKCEYKSCTFQGLLFHEKKHTIVTNDMTNMKNVVTDMTNMTNVMPAMTSVMTDMTNVVTNVMPAMTNVVTDVANIVTGVHGGLQIFQLPNTKENNHNVNNGGLQSIVTSEITCIQRPVPIETLQNEITANNAAAANNVHEDQNSKNIPKKFNCDKCHFITDRKSEIERHKKSDGYFSNNKSSCDQCDYTTCNFRSMPSHKKKHYSLDHNNKCHLCGKLLADKSCLNRHLKTVHNIVDGTVKSVEYNMDNTVKNIILEKSHENNMGNIQNETSISCNNQNNMYKCHICSDTSIDLASLQKHISMAHEIMEKISCEYCTEVFTERYSELNHMDKFHKEMYYQYYQKYSYFFKQANDTTSFTATATNLINGKFKCHFDLCISEYAHKRDLARHMKQKHSNFSSTEEISEKYDCDKCCYTTYQAYHLKAHKKRQGYLLNEEHKCHICENWTSCTISGLTIHMRTFNHQNTTTSSPRIANIINLNTNLEDVIEGKPILIGGHKEEEEKLVEENSHEDVGNSIIVKKDENLSQDGKKMRVLLPKVDVESLYQYCEKTFFKPANYLENPTQGELKLKKKSIFVGFFWNFQK